MSREDTSDRPKTARGYKGPRWLIDRLPRYSSSSTGRDSEDE
ncbi:hypothetical protein [Salinarchaeum laminariae]|nr:hypothetical protein [Salinarchaeum laminariae]